MSVVAETPCAIPISINGTQACGAKTRKGGICKAIATSQGKCIRHGGRSLSGAASPSFKHGQKSKYTYLPPQLTARFEQLMYRGIEDLEESHKIQTVLETQLLERLDTNESPAAWGALAKTLDSIGSGENDLSPSQAVVVIQTIVDGAIEQISLRREIQSFHESQRKLAEAISKIRKESQETYTQEQWNGFMNVQLNILREVLEARQMQNYLDKVRHFTDKNPKVLKA